MAYVAHRIAYKLVSDRIEADALDRINDARKRAFQGYFFKLTRGFVR